MNENDLTQSKAPSSGNDDPQKKLQRAQPAEAAMPSSPDRSQGPSAKAGKCQPCHGQAKLLDIKIIREYLKKVLGWQLAEDQGMILKHFQFKNFSEVLKFVNQIAQIAEEEDHHPNLYIHDYRKLRVELSTHAVKGLSENDFILAAKIDGLSAQKIG